MKYDKPLVAALLGALATIPYELYTRLLVSLGFGKYSVYQLNSLVITINRPTAIIGIVSTFITGGLIGVVFYYSLKKLGTDFVVIKGLAAGLFGWVFTETIFTWLIEGPRLIQPRPMSDYYLEISGAAIFGLTLGLLFKRYLIKETTKSKI